MWRASSGVPAANSDRDVWEVVGTTAGTLIVVVVAVCLREVVRLRERVAWLEAKVNGKDGRGKVT